MMATRRRSQRGDTLVEVLISILVVSMILTGAYVTTNRSTIGVRDAQEHAEALKLVQGQLEQVRYSASRPDKAVFNQPTGAPFCMLDGQPTSATVAPGLTSCIQDGSGNASSEQPAYKLLITRSACQAGFAANCSQFTLQATWASVTGKGDAMEQITYRLYR